MSQLGVIETFGQQIGLADSSHTGLSFFEILGYPAAFDSAYLAVIYSEARRGVTVLGLVQSFWINYAPAPLD